MQQRALSDALSLRVLVITSEQRNWLLRYEPPEEVSSTDKDAKAGGDGKENGDGKLEDGKESGGDADKESGGEAKAAILGGHVTVGVAGVSEFAADVEAGRMRALGISSSFRLRGLPTLKDQGVNVEIYNWRGVYGAPGITPEQRKTLTDAVVKATEHASWKETLRRNDWGPFLLTGDEFGRYVDAESARLGGMLREIGVIK